MTSRTRKSIDFLNRFSYIFNFDYPPNEFFLFFRFLLVHELFCLTSTENQNRCSRSALTRFYQENVFFYNIWFQGPGTFEQISCSFKYDLEQRFRQEQKNKKHFWFLSWELVHIKTLGQSDHVEKDSDIARQGSTVKDISFRGFRGSEQCPSSPRIFIQASLLNQKRAPIYSALRQ